MIAQTLSTIAIVSLAATGVAEKLPQSLDVDVFRTVVVQHDGRWMPLDTLARDTVESITGREAYLNRDAVLWLLAWGSDAKTWASQPLITIGNAELRGELQLPPDRTTFSFSDLAGHRRLNDLFEELRHLESDRKMNPLESKVSDIYEKLIKLQGAFGGEGLRLIPNASDPQGNWTAIAAQATHDPQTQKLSEAWDRMKSAFLADDAGAFAAASQDVVAASRSLPAAYRPNAAAIEKELHYNQLNPFALSWKLMLVGAVIALAALLAKQRWLDILSTLGLMAGLALATYGIWLRWDIAGRVPASNMYESLLFLGWGVGAFAIIAGLFLRIRLVPLTAAAMSALALFLADVLPVDHFIRPIPPVLADTVWMAIHVPVIMVSYSVLALAVLIAHVQLVFMTAAPRNARMSVTIDALHYWYVHVGSILLTVGIITGSMWAASSWGRYWGWDPKEVWSLVALLGYLCILHVRIDHEAIPRWGYFIGAVLLVAILGLITPRLAPLTSGKIIALGGSILGMGVLVLTRGPFAAAVKSIMCFWLIIMTYVGVNYVLGIGLHSYGFGTGAVVRYMFLLGTIDLSFVVLFTALYLWRRRTTEPRPAARLSVA